MKKIENRQIKAWYIVFINAFVGCAIAAGFPQFSMTVYELSEKSGISTSILLTSDTVKACGIVVGMLVSGFIYNKIGAKLTFLLSMVAGIIPQFLLPHMTSVLLLMILKVMQGFASLIFPVFLVIIMEYIDEKNLGIATALFNGIFYGGGGIGGTFAGLVISNSDWLMSYYALGLVMIALAIVWLFTVKPPKKSSATETPKKKGASDIGLKKIALLSIAFFATTWMVQAITVDLSLFGVDLGYNEIELSKVLTAVTIAMILACIVSGKVSDIASKNAERKDIARINVLIIGYLIAIIGIFALVLFDTSIFNMFYIATFLFTFGGSWGLGAFYSILPEIYDEHQVPIVTGITGGVGDMGMPIAPLVVGVFFGVRGLWSIGWSTCAAIALISITASLVLKKNLRKNHEGS